MITLSEFIEMWWGNRYPILVYTYEDYSDIEADIDQRKGWDEYAICGEFCIDTNFSQFKTKVYLKDSYANAKVECFHITPDGMVIFIKKAEEQTGENT